MYASILNTLRFKFGKLHQDFIVIDKVNLYLCKKHVNIAKDSFNIINEVI